MEKIKKKKSNNQKVKKIKEKEVFKFVIMQNLYSHFPIMYTYKFNIERKLKRILQRCSGLRFSRDSTFSMHSSTLSLKFFAKSSFLNRTANCSVSPSPSVSSFQSSRKLLASCSSATCGNPM